MRSTSGTGGEFAGSGARWRLTHSPVPYSNRSDSIGSSLAAWRAG